jgi:outer membrane protein
MLSKIAIVLSSLALIISGYLIYKINQGPSSALAVGDTSPAPTAAAFANRDSAQKAIVAFVNGDSIMSKYDYFKDMEANLESTYKTSRSKIQGEIDNATKESEELISYAEGKGASLPQDEAQVIQQKLMDLEYKIQNLKAQEEEKFVTKQNDLNLKLMDKIKEYLKRYCAEHGIDVCMNYMDLNQSMLYGNTAFDITGSVVEGLNAEYQIEKAKQQK